MGRDFLGTEEIVAQTRFSGVGATGEVVVESSGGLESNP